MKIKCLAAMLAVSIALTGSAKAQSPPIYFGKNAVNWQNEKPKQYKSEHFDVFYFGFDLTDPEQKNHFKNFIGNIEGGYKWLRNSFQHDIERRIPVAVYATHSQLETGAAYVIGEFLPEGVGAFVESVHRRMYTKEDLLPVIRREANIHELVHEFQFDSLKLGLIQRVAGQIQLPSGFFEGGAEFIANLYDPVPLDNIRRIHQRMAASNRRTIPTWTELANDQVNGYTMWMMVFQMLEDKYGKGIDFQVNGLQIGSVQGLGLLINDFSKGELGNPSVNPEKFDQQFRDYWHGIFGKYGNMPRPYQETDNIKSRSVTPHKNYYPMLLACQFPDGKRLAAFTGYKGRPVLASYTIPEEFLYAREIKFNDKTDNGENGKNGNENGNGNNPKKDIKILTPQMPPVPFEYLIIQGFETWPFNGSDAGCSSDGKQITFFARINRDHALVVIDAKTGKILKKIEFESPLPQLNQGFSPVFSPDGKVIYFSAAYHITRDLYSLKLENLKLTNLTNDSRFDTAPAVSPDGTEIIYVGQDGDFQHLFVLDLATGDKRQLTFGRFNDSSPSWSEDGKKLAYVSDFENNIWNLYTLDLETMVSSQWTEFMGQVLTPMFVKGQPDKVYYTVYWDEDQYEANIYSNFEIYEATLKQPISQQIFSDKGESTEYSFQPFRNLFQPELDINQLANKAKPEEQWQRTGGDVYFGTSTYWGVFSSSYLEWNNMLETKHHLFRFAYYSDFFRMADYVYVNQENRLARAYNLSYQRVPMRYFFYDIIKRYPKQFVLMNTQMTESSVGISALYPLNKFNRWEIYAKIRHRGYNLFDLDDHFIREVNSLYPEAFSDTDLQMSRFLSRSGSMSLVFGGAYVRDTVLYSYKTQGFYHGNTLKVQFEAAPPAGKTLDGYASFGVNARTYRSWTAGSLFAGRVDFLKNSRANGDFLLLCGPEMLRGCPYGSMAGNEVAYVSGEFRFPVLDALVFPYGIAVGPIRGLLFADAGMAKFSDEKFAAQKGKAYGFGVQYVIPFIGWPAQSVWTRTPNGKWAPTFYVTVNW